jgi:hypothetical protein
MNSRSIFLKIVEFIFIASILYASFLLIKLSIPYIHFIPGIEFLVTKQLIYHIDWWRWSFYIHVFFSPIVILSGLFQFFKKLPYRFPKLHRSTGKVYIFTILFLSGPSGLIMSFFANGGYPAQVSFVTLSICWIVSTYLGYHYARKQLFDKHLLWTFRSYALTLSAVTLRFYAYLFDVFKVNLPPVEAYTTLAYLSWIPNLIVVQLLQKFGYIKSFLKKD